MIESVSTSFVQGASLRSSPQTGSTYAVSNAVSSASSVDVPRYGTRLYVRLDSGAERAILEVRSSDTGDVVKQYPSEAQIRAFERAASLKQAQDQTRAVQGAEQQARQQADAQAVFRDTAQPSGATETAAPQRSAAPATQPAPDLYQASAPRSSAPAASTPDISSGRSVSSGSAADGAPSSGQSILV